MQEAKPSQTAMRVAMRRAAHQIFDQPKVFDDPVAVPIIGPEAEAKVRNERRVSKGRVADSVRAFMVARSRYAEDRLAAAVAGGVRQYIVLGAGLDTFAYRNPHERSGLRVFEVDHPATLAWKRRKLAAAGIPIPESVTYAAIDFERQTTAAGLHAAGFDAAQPAFFSWLGVIMYLSENKAAATLEFIASLPQGSGVAFDFAVPRSTLGFWGRLALDTLSMRVAAAGEPFQTFYEPGALREKLIQFGFHAVECLDADAINARYFTGRADGLRIRGNLGRLISAQV